MKKIAIVIIGIVVLFFGCTGKRMNFEEDYNQKANEVILQVIKDTDCDCMLEIPKESLIEISTVENPSYDIRSYLINELETQNNFNLDSLVEVSKDFRLDAKAVEENKIKIVTLENLRSSKNDYSHKILKMCPKGIICIRKPIFDKTFQKAVIDYGFAFTCVKVLQLPSYEFEKGKWKRVYRKNNDG